MGEETNSLAGGVVGGETMGVPGRIDGHRGKRQIWR